MQTTFWMHFSEWKYINFYIKYANNFFVIHLAVITLVAMSPERVYVYRSLVNHMKTTQIVNRLHSSWEALFMGLLPNKRNYGLRMRRECRERFPRHRLQRKPPVSDPDMHHGTFVTHVPWCMSESLTHTGEENVPGIPGACATRNFAYLVKSPCSFACLS